MAFVRISLGALVLFAITASELVVQLVWGHGKVMEPPNRASLFRFPEFDHANPPENWNDNQMFCGGNKTQYELNGGKCGICGDPYNDPVPRAYEDGGVNYTGIIVRGYRSGQLMPVEVDLTASHHGYFLFRLCAKDDTNSHLSQECYDKYPLTFVNETTGTSETKYRVPIAGQPYYARYALRLPKGVTCKHCVLQWHYQTGTTWGICPDGTGALGCGDIQENFRSCSDIIIYPEDSDERQINRNPSSKFGIPPPADNDTDLGQDVITTNSSSTTEGSSSWQLFHGLYHQHPIHG